MIAHAIESYNRRNGFGRFAPKVVLFDMDGTLINSMPNHAIAWTRMFHQHGIVFTEEDAYIEEGARGVDTIRKHVFLQKNIVISEARARDMYNEKAQIFASLPAPPMMDGALELMEKITQSGLTIGIVTGSAQETLIERIQSYYGKYVSEQHIVTALDVKKGKPDAEPYVKGMEKCGGYKPNETIAVENAPLGIKSANAAGAFTIAVNTGPLSNDTLLKAGAHVLVKCLNDLYLRWSKQ